MTQFKIEQSGVSEREHSLLDRRTVSAALMLIGIFLLSLYLEGRPAWCEDGLAFWSPAWNSCTSQNLFDPYSMSHVLHGVIFFWLLRLLAPRVPLAWRLVAAMGLEIGWEVLENSPWIIARYRQDTAAFDYTGDSIVNSFGDVVSTVAGFVFASRFGWKASLALVIVFELWMLWIARDNLSLNILMLLHPIDAIKEWQLAGITPVG